MLDLIYPPICGICGKINKNNLCTKCMQRLKLYEINRIEDYRDDKTKHFDYLIKTFKYEGIIRNKIIDYKFNEKAYLYKTFEKMVTKNEKIYSFLKKYDIILYVPMFKKRKLERGYNQTEIIAKQIAKKLEISFEKKNLIKMIDTKKQSTLTKFERTQNVKNVFAVRKPDRIREKNIIIFDDIYTTGNTVNECSKILKKAGAREIVVITIAID